MAHSHSHSHHDHVHLHGDQKGKRLFITIFLNILITVAQVVGGIISGSLSLISDALHNFSDVLSLLVSYFANLLSKKKASPGKTYGYKRAEILAAFINSASLMIISLVLIKEAIERFLHPAEVAADLVIWLSLLGIIFNGGSVLLLKRDAAANMNLKSAYLHLITDMLASVAVLVGGILMKWYQLYWVDPLLTLIIAVYLIYMGYNLLISSTRVLMLFTPDAVHVKDIVDHLNSIEGVNNVHHVHIWQLNEDDIHMEAHIDFQRDIRLSEFDSILQKIEAVALEKFGITHLNIQPEYGKCDDKRIIAEH
ncbi:cation diffusion facilitator family transporter [Zeaxanthinibacter enoshimensis]|uniref:Cobalt-zinc-cadmium efflux system protein n=1 Tax=Zeaxanthinibacter enoshimensis TaxID=392009 RepID=A0A4R6TNJ1_9FLAO|nr:cation diffusion facilitator family transporter [Zeaxanthinibacter enoshimensis]TDQ32825.1 cobalt-zinc-cadmium efflux system protein [Zeaxanthinibacter enoshimensis]